MRHKKEPPEYFRVDEVVWHHDEITYTLKRNFGYHKNSFCDSPLLEEYNTQAGHTDEYIYQGKVSFNELVNLAKKGGRNSIDYWNKKLWEGRY